MITKRGGFGAMLGLAALGFFGLQLNREAAVSASQAKGQKVVVHLSEYTTDLHAAFMALKLANAMIEGGAEVSLLLDLEGVRLADGRVPLNLMWGDAHEPLSAHYEKFTEAGGKVVLCPHCAATLGVEVAHLRKGAMIGIPEEQTIPKMLLEADKILDY